MTDSTKLPVGRQRHQMKTAESGWSSFDSLRFEIDRLFEDFMPSIWSRPLGRLRSSAARSSIGIPAVDVVEKDGRFEITAEMPGISSKDIDVTLSDGMLTIRGEKNENADKVDGDYHLSERSYGSVQRSFQLPARVDPDKIEATFSDGVLTVVLPKAADALRNERKIEIRAA